MREADNSRSIFLSVVGACFVRTSSLNDKHSRQLFRMGLRDKTTPTLTTPLIRANISCAINYHLLQSFFVRLHCQHEPFGSYIILKYCSSFFHGHPELFGSDHLLQSWVSLQLIVVITLQSFESGQALLLVFSVFLFLPLIISLSFLRSSVFEALFALSFSLLR